MSEYVETQYGDLCLFLMDCDAREDGSISVKIDIDDLRKFLKEIEPILIENMGRLPKKKVVTYALACVDVQLTKLKERAMVT